MRRHVLFSFIVAAAAPSAFAQQTGTIPPVDYSGTMNCAQLPGTKEPLRVPVTLRVESGTVRFERPVLAPEGKLQVGVETGSGRREADGTVVVATLWRGAGNILAGSYKGKLTPAGGTLKGEQVVTTGATQHPPRVCTIDLKR